MGRRTSEARLDAVRRDLARRLPRSSSEPPTLEQRYTMAEALVDALWGQGAWLRQHRSISDRALEAATDLVEARRRDRAEQRQDEMHVGLWMDRWILGVSETGLTGSVEGQEELRARLLARQRDRDRRANLQQEGAHGARVVLTQESQMHVHVLQRLLKVDTQQDLIALLLRTAYSVYEPSIDHRQDVRAGYVEVDAPVPGNRSWEEALAAARAPASKL